MAPEVALLGDAPALAEGLRDGGAAVAVAGRLRDLPRVARRARVIHAHRPLDALVARPFARALVLTWTGLPPMRPRVERPVRTAIARRALRSADAVVAESHAAAEALRRWAGVEARVIPPPVDVAALRVHPAARAAEPTVVAAADPGPRAALLRDAVDRARRDHPGLRLEVPTAGEASPADLTRAWVAVLPGRPEAFALPLARALACGTPAVGADRDLLDRPEVGRVAVGDDPAELAAAIGEALDLARHPATPVACRVRAAELAPDRCAAAHLALYEALLDRL